MIRLRRIIHQALIESGNQQNYGFMKKIQIILMIGLIHGLIYVFIIPPWQHYDEPGHFEYVWLIANRLKLPQVGDYDQNMRLAVGQSLIDSKFFGNKPLPNLTDPSQPIWIGIPQLVDPPLYYLIEAVPFYLLRGMPVDVQLHAGRIVSLLFLLITIYSVYKLSQELAPANHPIQWMAPLFIATLPSFVEFMSSLNDFTASIGLFSVWLLISVKLIKRFSFINLGILILVTLAGFFTQKLFYPAVLYLPVVLLLSVLPGKVKFLGWLITAATIIAGVMIAFNWHDAALWLRANNQDAPSRAQIQEDSKNVFALDGKVYPDADWGLQYPSWNPGFFQLVPSDIADRLRGKTVTIGAWVWSDAEIPGYGPGLNSLLQFQDNWLGFSPVELSRKPQFIASVVQVPLEQDRLQIWLRTTSAGVQNATIYFSGVVLVEGIWPVNTPPLLTDADGTSGIWGNKTFNNLVRNAQFLHAWPYLKPQLFSLITSKIQDLTSFHISSFVSVLLDVPGTAWYTKATGDFIFKTFWAEFCWGQVPLISNASWFHPYRLLLVFTSIGIAGAILTGYKLVGQNKHGYAFLVFIVAMSIVVALFYGVYTMGGALRYRSYIPTARYLFPAILPISIFLVLGWQGLVAWLTKLLKLSHPLIIYLYLGFFIALDILSFASIYVYFYKS